VPEATTKKMTWHFPGALCRVACNGLRTHGVPPQSCGRALASWCRQATGASFAAACATSRLAC
jgi:hypothetical protein